MGIFDDFRLEAKDAQVVLSDVRSALLGVRSQKALQPAAAQSQVFIHIDCQPLHKGQCAADEGASTNLVGNAVKYNHPATGFG